MSDPLRYEGLADRSGWEFSAHPEQPDWETLYVTFYPRLLSYAMTLGLDSSAAEDVVQMTFMALLRRWQPEIDRQIKNIRAYMFAVARNAAVDTWRRQKLVNVVPVEDLDPGFLPALPSAEEQALENSEGGAATTILRDLPPRQRQTLALAMDGYTATEIAEQLGITANAVRVNLHHARAKALGRLKPASDAA